MHFADHVLLGSPSQSIMKPQLPKGLAGKSQHEQHTRRHHHHHSLQHQHTLAQALYTGSC